MGGGTPAAQTDYCTGVPGTKLAASRVLCTGQYGILETFLWTNAVPRICSITGISVTGIVTCRSARVPTMWELRLFEHRSLKCMVRFRAQKATQTRPGASTGLRVRREQ